MRLITQTDGDVSIYFDVIDENEYGIDNWSWKQILLNNHTEYDRGLIRGLLPLAYIFGFCKSFRKKTKGLDFELELGTSKRNKDFLYTTFGDEVVNVTNNSINLLLGTLIHSPETENF